ncbi:MAG: hypothetical protein Q4A74_02315 [Cardiobacteriaceae bacterium]|nr:hypothetical protein [Cardiobacteriaceae bacterium]
MANGREGNANGKTLASINTQNIRINDAAGQEALTGESVDSVIERANQNITLETVKAKKRSSE